MSIKINYFNKLNNKTSANIVLFADEKFNIDNLTHLDMRAEEYDLNEFVSMYKKLKPELINKFS